jgi:hypothetical protein
MRKSKDCPGDLLAVLARLAVLVGLAAWPAGCAGNKGDVLPRAPDGPAMDLAHGLYLRGENLRSLAARGAVNHEADGRRTYFRFEVLALKPDWLFFTAFDPAGRPAFRLTSAEGRLTGLIYGARQYFTGPATAENLNRLLPLNLTLDQLMALLCGSTARPAAAGARARGDNTELTLVPVGAQEDESEVWRLRLAGGLDQDPGRTVLIAAVRGPAGRPNLSLRYHSVKYLPREDEPGLFTPFPTSVEAEWTRKKQFLRLTYDEVSLGPKLNPDLFVLTPPDGFEVVPLP